MHWREYEEIAEPYVDRRCVREDDGAGPYTYCERGRSHCLDQCCACVDTWSYRRAYRRTRGEYVMPLWPWATALFLAGCAVAGYLASGS
jgi:hypothetical protein